ncbi:MAG: prolipoprotein diacylglyceryl transferase family protein [Candidatus Gottesmanbacteria bacterium]
MYPILISLGSIRIYSFGLFLVLAIIIGSFVVWRVGKNLKFDEEKIIDLLLVEMIFGLIGARIFHIFFHFQDFGFNFFRWLLIYHFPGLTFIGGLLGGLIGMIYFSRKENWPFWQIADISVLGISLAEAIASIGAFFSGSAYGITTNLPWAVPVIGLPELRHPVQIYQALILLFIFLFLIKVDKWLSGRNFPHGLIFLIYVLCWGVTHYLLDILRGDSVYFYGYRLTQIICLFLILFSVILLYIRLGRSLKEDLLAILQKVRPTKYV